MSARPNILLIITHDTGRHLGCYGWPVATPHLNRLAAEGVRFDNYHCTAPQCSPSRASILTGQYPHSHGMMGLLGGGWSLPDDAITLPKSLAAAGYATWLWGFQHEHEDSAALGYQHDPIGYQRGDVPKILCQHVVPRVCDWLRAQGAANSDSAPPFFASVGVFETHIPFRVDPASPASIAEVKPLPYLPDHPAIRQDVVELQREVQIVDSAVGQILAALDESGLADNTLVIVTTDHGIPFPRAKCSLYAPGTGTALLMRLPGRLAANRTESALLSNIDLMPTLLEVAEAATPASVQGRSFWPLLVGGAYEPREEVFTELTYHSVYDPSRCIRTHRYAYIRHWDPPLANLQPKDYWDCCAGSQYLSGLFNHPWPAVELYDLAADPHELHNLARRHDSPPLIAALDERLLAWMAATGDPLLHGPIPLPAPAG